MIGFYNVKYIFERNDENDSYSFIMILFIDTLPFLLEIYIGNFFRFISIR